MHLFRRLNGTGDKPCVFDERLFADDLRLLLVGILGSCVSVLSLLQNVLLFYVFSTSRKLRRQNYVNPVLLALFDVLVSAIYLLISPTHFFAHRAHSPALVAFWASNMRALFCLEHFALTVCNLLLVVASLERYLANGSLYSQKCVLVFIVRNKPYVIAAILAFAFLLKATLYFEIGLVQLPECANLTDSLVPVWLASNATLFQAARFWTRNFLTVILPFLILAFCNLKIVQQLRERRRMTLGGENSGSLLSQTNPTGRDNEWTTRQGGTAKPEQEQHSHTVASQEENPRAEKWHPRVRLMPRGSIGGLLEPTAIVSTAHAHHQRQQQRRMVASVKSRGEAVKSILCDALAAGGEKPAISTATMCSPNGSFGVRVATRTLVMVVGCYLISNSMSTVLNIWEFFDVKFLRHDNFYAYLIASDIAALLTICGCALRLPIYVANDRRIRKAICRAFIRFRFCCTKQKPETIVRGEEADHFLEKYSIVIVSNSLRSNLTGVLSQFDWGTFQGKRSFDQLAILVQNRRKFLVQMTINLGAVHAMEGRKGSQSQQQNEWRERAHTTGTGAAGVVAADRRRTAATASLTDIAEHNEIGRKTGNGTKNKCTQ